MALIVFQFFFILIGNFQEINVTNHFVYQKMEKPNDT